MVQKSRKKKKTRTRRWKKSIRLPIKESSVLGVRKDITRVNI